MGDKGWDPKLRLQEERAWLGRHTHECLGSVSDAYQRDRPK